MKVLAVKVCFQGMIFGLEGFADGFLLVAIASHVRASVCDTELAYSQNLTLVQRNVATVNVGSSGRRIHVNKNEENRK
jgi:hypothetical protein